MNVSRQRVLDWTEKLLDGTARADVHRDAAIAWCDWALTTLGIDEQRAALDPANGFFAATRSRTGKAISPLAAAQCVREQRRTAVFMQATDAAIREARRRFPGEKIHVLEAGCGPLAPMTLPFALRYPPGEVCFSVLDLHEVSLDSVRRLAAELGVESSIHEYLPADATTVRFAPADRPHVIVCEVLLRALTREPQVAATLNLAPQLRPGGLFLPEKISVRAGLLDFAKYDRWLRGSDPEGSPVTELGEVFCLDAMHCQALRRIDGDRLAAEAVRVPPHGPRTPLHLFTRLQVLHDHRLGDFDSSLNLPERVKGAAPLAERGGIAEFHYEISAEPGLRVRAR